MNYNVKKAFDQKVIYFEANLLTIILAYELQKIGKEVVLLVNQSKLWDELRQYNGICDLIGEISAIDISQWQSHIIARNRALIYMKELVKECASDSDWNELSIIHYVNHGDEDEYWNDYFLKLEKCLSLCNILDYKGVVGGGKSTINVGIILYKQYYVNIENIVKNMMKQIKIYVDDGEIYNDFPRKKLFNHHIYILEDRAQNGNCDLLDIVDEAIKWKRRWEIT